MIEHRYLFDGATKGGKSCDTFFWLHKNTFLSKLKQSSQHSRVVYRFLTFSVLFIAANPEIFRIRLMDYQFSRSIGSNTLI